MKEKEKQGKREKLKWIYPVSKEKIFVMEYKSVLVAIIFGFEKIQNNNNKIQSMILLLMIGTGGNWENPQNA